MKTCRNREIRDTVPVSASAWQAGWWQTYIVVSFISLTQHNKNKVQACIAMVSGFIYQIKMNVNGSEKKHNIKTFH